MKYKEIFEHKGHNSEIVTTTNYWAFVPPNGGNITLNSEFINCKSEEMPLDSAAGVIKNIYKQYFKDKVDEYLENSNICRNIAL